MASTAALGALAGFTIFLGLPVARVRLLSSRARVALAMFAVGILAFIFVDVLAEGFGIVENALTAYKDHHGSFGRVVALALLLGVGFTAGSAGIAVFERRLRRAAPLPAPIAGGAVAEAFAPADQAGHLMHAAAARRAALQTGLI